MLEGGQSHLQQVVSVPSAGICHMGPTKSNINKLEAVQCHAATFCNNKQAGSIKAMIEDFGLGTTSGLPSTIKGYYAIEDC